MLDQETVLRIRKLREGGESIKVIAKIVGCSVGAVHSKTRDIKLSPEREEVLKRRSYESGVFGMSEEARHAACVRGGVNCAKLGNFERWYTAGTKASGLAYRKDELPTKAALEAKYRTVFAKEQLGNCYLDFCDANYVIEHTIDETQGVTDALRRFEVVAAAGDKRMRILYTKVRGARTGVRLRRLAELGVHIKHVDELT